MDTVHRRSLVLSPNFVFKRPNSPCFSRKSRSISMIDPSNLEIEPQRLIPTIDARPVCSFSSKDEYVEAMVEDLCDWFNYLYKLEDDNEMVPSTFFSQLEDGVILNKHAVIVQMMAESYLKTEKIISRALPLKIGNKIMKVPNQPPKYVTVDFTKKINLYHKRDNVSNFIQWCRSFGIPDSLNFETNDLILMKNPRNVVVCLLEIARIGGLFGIEVPDIIQLDEEINKEIVNETVHPFTQYNPPEDRESPELQTNIILRNKSAIPRKSSVDFDFRHSNSILLNKKSAFDCSDGDSGDFNYPSIKSDLVCSKFDNSDNESINSHGSQYVIPKYKTQKPVGRVKIYDCFDKFSLVREKKYREKCDMRSLDERVRDILSECQCCETFPMKRISEGKYQWGDKKTLIFVRILRNHVMVRVGGGWDTLNDFLRKHDHCRKDRPSAQKTFVPQIRKPLQPNVPCPVDLKSTIQMTYVHNGNAVDHRRNGVMVNLSRIENHDPVPILVIESDDVVTPKKSEPENKSDDKENSTNSTNPSIPTDNVDFQQKIPSSTVTKSNQKFLSKIPVLKKR